MPVLIHFYDKPALCRYLSILHRYVYTHIYTYLCTYIYFPEGMFTYFYGRRKERAMETKEVKEKGKGSQDKLAVELGFQESKGCSLLPRLLHQEDLPRPVWTFSQLSSGELGRLGLQCRTQRIALTRLEGIGRLPMALWSILEAKREATSSRVTLVQTVSIHHGWWWRSTRNCGSPRSSKDIKSTCSQSCPGNGC